MVAGYKIRLDTFEVDVLPISLPYFVEDSPPLYTLMATCYDIAIIFKHTHQTP
jgi:hypothetical protein